MNTRMLSLSDPVTAVPRVGQRLAAVLAQAPFAIRTVGDLVWNAPRQNAYKDLGATQRVADLTVGEPATVVGTVVRWERISPRSRGRRLTIEKLHLRDDAGGRIEVAFFNQPWLPGRHRAGTRAAVSGTVEVYRRALQLKGPKIIGLDDDAPAVDLDERLQPTYRATEALPSAKMARLIADALDALPTLEDHLPQRLRDRRDLPDLDFALRTIHRPKDLQELAWARRRLVYDELLGLQVVLQRRRVDLERNAVGVVNEPVAMGAADAMRASLPWSPTTDQERAFAELDQDLAAEAPMHRLLQGDVGTGKTLVAAHAMMRAVDAGRQAALMAPTQVLAEQHLRTFTDLLGGVVIPRLGRPPRIHLLVGSQTRSQRATVLREVLTGECDLLIATHAVLEPEVQFADLGVVVIDEQHRFGVGHRLALAGKRQDGAMPDVLVMTATPIPRSLALTVYGDLDVTVLRTRPGVERITVTTQVIRRDSSRRERLYDFVREEVRAGRRAYVVCPLIEPSEALDGIAAAVEVHEALRDGPFEGIGVGLMHGRMSADERDQVMSDFRAGTMPILVATTVIEVGVSVDEASVMIIEDADRFGISQLHQLRGRLYRGHETNFCVLFAEQVEDNPRLAALAGSEDGFELAELDLELRREGRLFDTAQTGDSDLRVASLIRDLEMIEPTRDDARALLAEDPDLSAHPALLAEVERRYDPESLATLEAG